MHDLPDGVYAASLTPLGADLSIDHAALAGRARWLLANGCSGVALMGTTGEANSFTVAERMTALDAVLEAGIPAERLLVGTGCCAVPDSVTLTRHAVCRGVGGVLMLPPFYYKAVRDDGVYGAFHQVIEQVGDTSLRIYLYHFPQMSAVPFSDALVSRLLKAYPRTIAGMKDSGGDWRHMERMMRDFPGFRVFAGTERFLLDTLRTGGAGCITATANVTCRLAGELYARWRSDSAGAMQARLTKVRAAIETYPMIPALRSIMAEITQEPHWLRMRPPQVRLTASEADSCLENVRCFLPQIGVIDE